MDADQATRLGSLKGAGVNNKRKEAREFMKEMVDLTVKRKVGGEREG